MSDFDGRTVEQMLQSDEFRAGLAYAATLLRHAVTADAAALIEPADCCRKAILACVNGAADALDETAGFALTLQHPPS